MAIKTVFFDLDGTLLPMDQDEFTRGYFKLLADKLAPFGYETEQLVKAIWSGMAAMVKNNGGESNEKVFWKIFTGIYGEKVRNDKPLFDEFYRVEFQKARELCGFNEKASAAVRGIKKKGIHTVLATNPVFPAIATMSRVRWTGLSPSDFLLCTTYENIGFCKPNPDYYREIIERISAKPEECLMVGNDVEEDMVAQKVGMNVFLLTDCLINKKGESVDKYPHGNFDDLMKYINSIKLK